MTASSGGCCSLLERPGECLEPRLDARAPCAVTRMRVVGNAQRTPHDGDWHVAEVGPVEWPAGAPLVVAVKRIRGERGGRTVVMVDRVEIRWE